MLYNKLKFYAWSSRLQSYSIIDQSTNKWNQETQERHYKVAKLRDTWVSPTKSENGQNRLTANFYSVDGVG